MNPDGLHKSVPREACRNLFREIVLPAPSPNGYEPIEPYTSWNDPKPTVVESVPPNFSSYLPQDPVARIIQPSTSAQVFLVISLRDKIDILPPHPGVPPQELENFIHPDYVFSDGSKGAYSPWRYPQDWSVNQPWNGYHTMAGLDEVRYPEASANAVDYFDFADMRSNGTGGQWLEHKLLALYKRREVLECYLIDLLASNENDGTGIRWLKATYGSSLPFFDPTEPNHHQKWVNWADGREWTACTIAYNSVLVALARWYGEITHLRKHPKSRITPSSKYMGVWVGSVKRSEHWDILFRSSLPLYGLFNLPSSSYQNIVHLPLGELHGDEIYREDAFGAVIPPKAFKQASKKTLKDAYNTHVWVDLRHQVKGNSSGIPLSTLPSCWSNITLSRFRTPCLPLNFMTVARLISWKLPFSAYLHLDKKICRSPPPQTLSKCEQAYRNWDRTRRLQMAKSVRSSLGGTCTLIRGLPLQRIHPVETFLPRRQESDGQKHRSFLECNEGLFYWTVRLGHDSKLGESLKSHRLSNGLDILWSIHPWPDTSEVAPPLDPSCHMHIPLSSPKRVYLSQPPTPTQLGRLMQSPSLQDLYKGTSSICNSDKNEDRTNPSHMDVDSPATSLQVQSYYHGGHQACPSKTGDLNSSFNMHAPPRELDRIRQQIIPRHGNLSSHRSKSRDEQTSSSRFSEDSSNERQFGPSPQRGRHSRNPSLRSQSSQDVSRGSRTSSHPRQSNRERSRSPPPRTTVRSSTRSSSSLSHAPVQAVPHLIDSTAPRSGQQGSHADITGRSGIVDHQFLSGMPLSSSKSIPLERPAELPTRPPISFAPGSSLAQKRVSFPYNISERAGFGNSQTTSPSDWWSLDELDASMQYEARRRGVHYLSSRLYKPLAPDVISERLVQSHFRLDGNRHPWRGTNITCYPIRILNIHPPDSLGNNPQAFAVIHWFLTRCGQQPVDNGVVIISIREEVDGTWCMDMGYRHAEDALLMWAANGSRPENEHPWFVYPTTSVAAGNNCIILPSVLVGGAPSLDTRITILTAAITHEKCIRSHDVSSMRDSTCLIQMEALLVDFQRIDMENNQFGQIPGLPPVSENDLPPICSPDSILATFADTNKLEQWSTSEGPLHEYQNSWWAPIKPEDIPSNFPAMLPDGAWSIEAKNEGSMGNGEHGIARRLARKRVKYLLSAYGDKVQLPSYKQVDFTLTPQEEDRQRVKQQDRAKKKRQRWEANKKDRETSGNSSGKPPKHMSDWVNGTNGSKNQPKGLTYEAADDEFLAIWDWYELCSTVIQSQRIGSGVPEGFADWTPFIDTLDDDNIVAYMSRDAWASLQREFSPSRRMPQLYGDEYTRLMGKISLPRRWLDIPDAANMEGQ